MIVARGEVMNVVRALRAWPVCANRLAVGVVAAGLTAGVLMLAGCSDFFPPLKNSSGGSGGSGGGGGGATGAGFVYTINAGTSNVSGFKVGTGTLTAVPNTPFALGYQPQAAVVGIGNAFLYVVGPTGISGYIINSDGSLTAPTTAIFSGAVNAFSLDVSPDGNWLFALDGTSAQLFVYQITPSTGALSLKVQALYSAPVTPFAPKMVKISSDGKYIYAALGTNGNAVFSFSTVDGTTRLIQQNQFTTGTNAADNAVAVDTAKFAYFARTGTGTGIVAYSIGTDGSLTAVNGGTVPAGSQPLAVALAGSGKFAYVANGNAGTISGFSLPTTGVANPLNGSPYASGATMRSLAVDPSGNYLLAASFAGPPDLYMYSLDITLSGKPTQATTVNIGTTTTPAGTLQVVSTH